jgi:integrase
VDVTSPCSRPVRIVRQLTELRNGSMDFTQPKTDAGLRSVHLPLTAVRDLERHLEAFMGPKDDALVFRGRGSIPSRPKTLSVAFRAAREICGLGTRFRFHDLRHFALTTVATMGATTKEVMRRAGHPSPAADLLCQHASDDRDRGIGRIHPPIAPPSTNGPPSRSCPIVATTLGGCYQKSL